MTSAGLSIERTVALPGLTVGPLAGAAVGSHLHLFTGAPGLPTQHLAVDGEGAVTVGAHVLAVSPVLAATAFDERMVLVCAGEVGGAAQPQVVLADTSGTPLQSVDVPVSGQLVHWPRVAVVDRRVQLVWAESVGARGNVLCGASWAPGEAAPARSELVQAPETVAGLDLAASECDAVVAAYGPPGGVAVSRVRDGTVDAAAVRDPDARVAVARVYPRADGWWVVVVDDSCAVIHPLDRDLQPAGARLKLPEPQPNERTRDALLVSDGGGRTVCDVQFEADSPGRVIASRGAKLVRAHAKRIREVVGIVESDRATVELDDPGIGYRAAAWLSDHLVVVHGSEVPLVTVMSAGA